MPLGEADQFYDAGGDGQAPLVASTAPGYTEFRKSFEVMPKGQPGKVILNWQSESASFHSATTRMIVVLRSTPLPV